MKELQCWSAIPAPLDKVQLPDRDGRLHSLPAVFRHETAQQRRRWGLFKRRHSNLRARHSSERDADGAGVHLFILIRPLTCTFCPFRQWCCICVASGPFSSSHAFSSYLSAQRGSIQRITCAGAAPKTTTCAGARRNTALRRAMLSGARAGFRSRRQTQKVEKRTHQSVSRSLSPEFPFFGPLTASVELQTFVPLGSTLAFGSCPRLPMRDTVFAVSFDQGTVVGARGTSDDAACTASHALPLGRASARGARPALGAMSASPTLRSMSLGPPCRERRCAPSVLRFFRRFARVEVDCFLPP